MKMLVCGGRDFSDTDLLTRTLDKMRKRGYTLVIHGGYEGADTLADEWAVKSGVDRIVFPANWTGRGKPAGPYRNALMLQIGKPDVVIAFPGGFGTDNMVGQARKAGVHVLRAVDPELVK